MVWLVIITTSPSLARSEQQAELLAKSSPTKPVASADASIKEEEEDEDDDDESESESETESSSESESEEEEEDDGGQAYKPPEPEYALASKGIVPCCVVLYHQHQLEISKLRKLSQRNDLSSAHCVFTNRLVLYSHTIQRIQCLLSGDDEFGFDKAPMKYSEKGVYDTIPAQAMRQKSTEYSNAEQCRV